MAREGRAGLGLLDRMVLVLAWIVTCGLVYVLGFYVGKGTQERRLGLEERIVRLPVSSQPPPEGQRPKSEDHFNFYEELMPERPPVAERDAAKPAIPGAAAKAPRPPAAQKPAVVSAPAAQRAAVASPVEERVPTAAPGKPAAPAPAPGRVAPTAEKPPAHPLPPPPPVAPSPPAHVPGGGWTVLANPTRSREEADALQRQLRGRGYEAALVRVVRDGDTWYRVQVGRFATPEQATEIMHRLRDHEGVSHAFVASD